MATVIKLEDPNKDFNRMLYQATRDIISGMQRADDRKHQIKMQEDRQAQQMEYLEKQAQLNLNNQLLVQKGQQQHKSAIKARELRNDTVAYDFFNKVSESTKYGRRLKPGQEALFGQVGSTILANASDDTRKHLQKEIQSWDTTNTDFSLEEANIQRAKDIGVPEKMLGYINKEDSSVKDTYDLYWGEGGMADSIVDETIASFKVGHLSLDGLADPNSSQSEALRESVRSAKGGLGDLSLVNRVLADSRFEELIATNSWYNTQLDNAVAKEQRLAMDLKALPGDRSHAANTTIALTAMKRNRIPIDVAKEALKKLDDTELGIAMAKFFKESAQGKVISPQIKQTIARLGDDSAKNLLAAYGAIERAENDVAKQSAGVNGLVEHLVDNPLDTKFRSREDYIRYGHLEGVKNAMQVVNGFTLLAKDPVLGAKILAPAVQAGHEEPSKALQVSLANHINEYGMDPSGLEQVKLKYQKEYNQSIAKELITGFQSVINQGTIDDRFSSLLAGIMADPAKKDLQAMVINTMEHVGPMQSLRTPWGNLDVRIKDIPPLVNAAIAMGTDTSNKAAMNAMSQLQLENNNSIVLTDADRAKYLTQLKPEQIDTYFDHRRIQQERNLVIQAGIDEELVSQNDHLKYNLSTPEAIRADIESKRQIKAKATDELIISQGLLSKQSPLTDAQLQLLVNASPSMREKVLARNSGMHTLAEQRIYDQTQLTQAHTRNYSALQKIVKFDTTLPKNQMLLRMVAWDDDKTRDFIREAINDDQSGTDKLGLKNANKMRGWVYETAIKNFHTTTNTAGLDLDFTPNADGTFDIFNRNDLTANGKPKKLTDAQIDGFARLAEEVVQYQSYVKKGMGILPGEAGFLAEDWTGTQKDINLLGASIAGRIFKESVYQGKIPEWGSVLEQGMALASRIAGSTKTLLVEDSSISNTERAALNVGRYSAAINDAEFKNPLSVPAVKQAIKKFRNHGITLGSDIEFEDRAPETTQKKSQFAGTYSGTFDQLFKTKSADLKVRAANYLGVNIADHVGTDDLTYHSAIIDKSMQLNADTAELRTKEGVAAMMFAASVMHSIAREGMDTEGYQKALQEVLPSIAASGAGDAEQNSAVFTQRVNAATADPELDAARSARNGWNTEFWGNKANKNVWMQDASKAELRQHLRIGQLLLRKLNYID